MVAPRHRSRSKKRVHKRVPGGATKLRFRAQKPKGPKCGICGKALKGIPRLGTARARNTAKSQKTVSRAYGGVLCAACLKAKLKSQVRGQ